MELVQLTEDHVGLRGNFHNKCHNKCSERKSPLCPRKDFLSDDLNAHVFIRTEGLLLLHFTLSMSMAVIGSSSWTATPPADWQQVCWWSFQSCSGKKTNRCLVFDIPNCHWFNKRKKKDPTPKQTNKKRVWFKTVTRIYHICHVFSVTATLLKGRF